MQFRLKLVASVAASLLASGAAFSAVSYTPGTYDGEAIGRNGPVKVQVTVGKDRITAIRVVSHNESAGLSDAPINNLPKAISGCGRLFRCNLFEQSRDWCCPERT